MKPRVYIETSVLSYLTALGSRDLSASTGLATLDRGCHAGQGLRGNDEP